MENKFSITSYFPGGKYSLPKVAIYAKPQNVNSNNTFSASGKKKNRITAVNNGFAKLFGFC